MSSFKQLNKADITTTPYAANKQWSFTYTSVPNNNIVFSRGKKEDFSITGAKTNNGQYQSLVYNLINHSFYQAYSGSLLDTGSLMFNTTTYESASQQRPTASYFKYNINPLFVDNFPTASNSTINVLSVNQSVFGSKILPNSFIITSSTTFIKDDGYGNLYSGSVHAGNIFYAQGIVVITNQLPSYQNLLTGSFSSTRVSFQNEHIIYENEVRCIVRESDFNLSYNPTLVSGSDKTTGRLRNFATSSFFQPYVTTIGLYNDDNDLLAVAKLSEPIALSSDTDMTFIVRYDT